MVSVSEVITNLKEMAALFYYVTLYVVDKMLRACGCRPQPVRRENVIPEQPRAPRRIGCCKIALVAIIIIGLCTATYFVAGVLILKSSRVDVTNMNAQYNNLNLNKTNTSVSLEAQFGLQVKFQKKGIAKVYPDMGTYVLSTSVNDDILTAVSSGKFQISEYEQFIVLKFDSGITRFTEDELRKYQKKLDLDNGATWIQLDVHLKMHVKLARFLAFPFTSRHLDFTCKFSYKNGRRDERGCILV